MSDQPETTRLGEPDWYGPPPAVGSMAPPRGGVAGPSNSMAIASLVAGIASLVLCMTFVVGALAVVLGVVGLYRGAHRGGAKRGEAIAGIVLGVLSVVVGALAWVAVFLAVDNVSEVLESAVGPADPTTFSILLQECTTSQNAKVTASGVIENTSGSIKSFEIEIEFARDDSVIEKADSLVLNLAPGDVEFWAVVGYVPGTAVATCQVGEVNNYLN